MFTILPTEAGPLLGRNISLRKKKQRQNAGYFFLSHACKLNQQKQSDFVLNSAANIYPSNKYDIFLMCLLLTNHETLYN